ncbi:MAG: class I SAM-dependent methyltransferase [Cytophagales bacterium]|jgi:ubiquinone/menaquinone biosynthesis C-methylase UbiE|nr:class I SAM-dependent methyltransferase [Cytophagales bacterium]MCA6388657.1 class I SAM-dependent methyltransferase [Cytophagales bacterium]MCA6393293.1 class I SAM-dependent methyltransferase [Cytophagales bacterium]MCA6396861.1 class I SAM-dependent methyltransferase [Cytophagales bacterium]MCA6398015.1 class I SAM-dependent methyltransferase [Cytophagales bacterium]
MMDKEKEKVRDFWNEASCGEELYLKGEEEMQQFKNQMQERYHLEPFILNFADFKNFKKKKVLEIGVGLGSDHQQFAEEGAELSGIDLTERAIRYATQRLSLFGLKSNLAVGDAENLSFSDETFDLVYSWGVIHHSPNTRKCVHEIFRVLKPNGSCKVMIYHKHSMVGYMLWIRYALLTLKPFTSLETIYSKYLESPGTKAYSLQEAKQLFSAFKNVRIETILGHGDLLTSQAGQRHKGFLLDLARKIYPRWLIRTFFKKHGLAMLIEADK